MPPNATVGTSREATHKNLPPGTDMWSSVQISGLSSNKLKEVVQLGCGSLLCEGAMWDFSNMSKAINLLALALSKVASGRRFNRSSSHPAALSVAK